MNNYWSRYVDRQKTPHDYAQDAGQYKKSLRSWASTIAGSLHTVREMNQEKGLDVPEYPPTGDFEFRLTDAMTAARDACTNQSCLCKASLDPEGTEVHTFEGSALSHQHSKRRRPKWLPAELTLGPAITWVIGKERGGVDWERVLGFQTLSWDVVLTYTDNSGSVQSWLFRLQGDYGTPEPWKLARHKLPTWGWQIGAGETKWEPPLDGGVPSF